MSISLLAHIEQASAQFEQAQIALGQGTLHYADEAAWLVLWAAKLPLDTDCSSAGFAAGAPKPAPTPARGKKLAR